MSCQTLPTPLPLQGNGSRHRNGGLQAAGTHVSFLLWICLAVLSVSCASSQPRTRAAGRAVDDLLEDLEARWPGFAEAQKGKEDAKRVILGIPDADLRTDVYVAIHKKSRGMTVLARDMDKSLADRLLAEQMEDDFDSQTRDAMAGLALTANLAILSSREDMEGGDVSVTLRALDLTHQRFVGAGTGGSDGRWEKAGRGGVVALRWLVVPFFVIADIGGTSIEYSFEDQKKRTVFGTIGRGILAIVYSPIAIFTSKYGKTRGWVKGSDE